MTMLNRFPFPHPESPDVMIVGEDAVGLIAESEGLRYYLTACCLASAKGTANAESGVCCRACYAELDPAMGGVPGESGPTVYRVTLPEEEAR